MIHILWFVFGAPTALLIAGSLVMWYFERRRQAKVARLASKSSAMDRLAA